MDFQIFHIGGVTFPFLRLFVIFHLVRIQSIHSLSHNSFTMFHFQSRRLSQVLPDPLEIMTTTTLWAYTCVSAYVTMYVLRLGTGLSSYMWQATAAHRLPVRWVHSWMNEWVAAAVFVVEKKPPKNIGNVLCWDMVPGVSFISQNQRQVLQLLF